MADAWGGIVVGSCGGEFAFHFSLLSPFILYLWCRRLSICEGSVCEVWSCSLCRLGSRLVLSPSVSSSWGVASRPVRSSPARHAVCVPSAGLEVSAPFSMSRSGVLAFSPMGRPLLDSSPTHAVTSLAFHLPAPARPETRRSSRFGVFASSCLRVFRVETIEAIETAVETARLTSAFVYFCVLFSFGFGFMERVAGPAWSSSLLRRSHWSRSWSRPPCLGHTRRKGFGASTLHHILNLGLSRLVDSVEGSHGLGMNGVARGAIHRA